MGYLGRTLNGQAFDQFDAWPVGQNREQLPSLTVSVRREVA
jgi:hypothetical protein